MEKIICLASEVYLCVLLFFMLCFCFRRYYIKTKKMICFLVPAVFAAAYIAYCIVPDPSIDLYRYFEIIDYFREINVNAAIMSAGEYDISKTSRSLYDVILAVVALQDNNHWLPFVSNFFFYSVYLVILFDYNHSNVIEMVKVTFFVILLLSLTFIPMNISNLRYPCAASLMALALYKDTYKEEPFRKVLMLYLCSIAIHIGVIPFIILRFFVQCRISEKKWVAILLLFWSFLGNTISGFMKGTRMPLLQAIGDKLSYYYNHESAMWDVNLVRYLVFFSFLVLFLILLKHKENNALPQKYKKTFFLIFIFVVGSMKCYQLFARYYYIIAFFGMPYLWESVSFRDNGYKCRMKSNAIFMIFLGLFIIFFQFRIMKYYDMANISWIWR